VKAKRFHAQALGRQVPLKMGLRAFGLHKSSYYYQSMRKPNWAKNVERSDKRTRPLDGKLVHQLLGLSGYELTLGYQKLTYYLRTVYAQLHNKKKMYRHMKTLKLLQAKAIKNLRKKKKGPHVLFYSACRGNVRWEADLTVVSYDGGQLYLFTVMDTYDKEIIGSWLGFRCRCQEALASLEQAINSRFPDGKVSEGLELTLRLDRGCQFTAQDFGQKAREYGLRIEYCDVQAPNQKPYIESLFSNFKREEVYRNDYRNPLDVFRGWETYVEWYNTKRPHASIGFTSPVQFRKQQVLNLSLVEA